MSVRSIIVSDNTNPEYGKIGLQFLPSSIQPINEKTQTITYTSNVTIAQGITSIVDIEGPSEIGNLNGITGMPFTNEIGSSKVLINAQIVVTNMPVDVGPGQTPLEILPMQFYLSFYDSNQPVPPEEYTFGFQRIFPTTTQNPIGERINYICPTIYLMLSGATSQADVYYYSGVGTLQDYMIYEDSKTFDTVQLEGQFITPTGTNYISVIPPELPANEAGAIGYVLSFSLSN